MEDRKRAERLAAYYARLYGTRNPFRLAESLGILYQMGECGPAGCYMFLKNHRYIFINCHLEGAEKDLVMAHELGHALLDRKANCYYIRNKTLLLNSRFERRANLFAAYLLISSDMLQEYEGHTADQFARCTGYPAELLALRMEGSLTR